MAEASKERSLEETSTWAVAVVCFVLVFISILIEHVIHLIGKWLTNKHKSALYEALEKIKAELMLLGFISLLLTVVQERISDICIPKRIAATWQPCDKKLESVSEKDFEEVNGRMLLEFSDFAPRRSLATKGYDTCTEKGKVAFVSAYGIHQLHVFIFVLAVFHVLFCTTTLALGRTKMRKWKSWEKETETVDYMYQNDPKRFRFLRDTSFGQRHLNFWSKSSISLWIVCFFRQFFGSITKVDYLVLRRGFIMAHLPPESETRFNFQKYIKRSLEEDFKVVVGISPIIWFFAVLFLLLNINGIHSYLWIPFIPLIIILSVGAKLQVIITKMGLRIQERGGVVKGVPLVQPGDDLFWFGRPRFMLFLIQFILFQNSFQLAFFAWSTYEFGFKSCFHKRNIDIIIRLSMGIIVQFFCSYVTFPLYALVTQMGSTMRATIFGDGVANALKNWQRSAKKKRKHNTKSETDAPFSSRPATPTHGMSPVHLLQNHNSRVNSFYTSPRSSNFENDHFEAKGLPIMYPQNDGASEIHRHDSNINQQVRSFQEPNSMSQTAIRSTQHEIEMGPSVFSFDK